jgi:hypothetical protein
MNYRIDTEYAWYDPPEGSKDIRYLCGNSLHLQCTHCIYG